MSRRGGVPVSEVPCLGRGGTEDPVQCIMGNGHMGPPVERMINGQT